MRHFPRLVIADRSLLAHNVYQTILRPSGVGLFHFNTFKELREQFREAWHPAALLINSNTIHAQGERHLGWLEEDERVRNIPKLFLCAPGEETLRRRLQKMPRGFVLTKPFYPAALARKVQTLVTRRGS